MSGKGLFIKDTALGDVVVLGPSLSKAGEQDKLIPVVLTAIPCSLHNAGKHCVELI